MPTNINIQSYDTYKKYGQDFKADDISEEVYTAEADSENAPWMINETLDQYQKDQTTMRLNDSLSTGKLHEDSTDQEKEVFNEVQKFRDYLDGEGNEITSEQKFYLDQISMGKDPMEVEAEFGGLQESEFDPVWIMADIGTGGWTALGRGALNAGAKAGSKMLAKEVGREVGFGVAATGSMFAASEYLGMDGLWSSLAGIGGPTLAYLLIGGTRSIIKNRLRNWRETNPNLYEDVKKVLKEHRTNVLAKNILDDMDMQIPLKNDPAQIKAAHFEKQFRDLNLEQAELDVKLRAGELLSPEELKRAESLPKEISKAKAGFDDWNQKTPLLEIRKVEGDVVKTPVPTEKYIDDIVNEPLAGHELKINWNRWETDADTKQIIDQMSKSIKEELDQAKRGVKTLEQTEADALKKLTDDVDFGREVLGRTTGTIWNAEQSLAARKLLDITATETTEAAERFAKSGTTENLNAMIDSWQRTQRMVLSITGNQAEQGRALSANRIVVGNSKEQLGAMEMVMYLADGSSVTSKELAEMLVVLKDNTHGFLKFLQGAGKQESRELMYNYYINSLLSNPQTQIVNISGTALAALGVPFERLGASLINLFKKQQTGVQWQEAHNYLIGLMKGVPDAWRLKSKLWANVPVAEIPKRSTKLEGATNRVISKETETFFGIFPEMSKDASDVMSAGYGLLTFFHKMMPTNILNTVDGVAKVMNGRGELQALAFRNARQKGLSGRELLDDMAKTIDNPPPHILSGVEKQQKDVTFQTDPGPWTETAGKIIRLTPGGRYAVPFVRVPMNLAKFAFDRSPAAPIADAAAGLIGKQTKWGKVRDKTKLLTEQVRNSKGKEKEIYKQLLNATGAERDLMLARVALGSTFMISMVGVAATGVVTGSGPPEPELRKTWLRMGNQPYSINVSALRRMADWTGLKAVGERLIPGYDEKEYAAGQPQDGDLWLSYRRFDPLATPIGLAADWAAVCGLSGNQFEADDMAAGIIGSISQNFTSKTYMKNAADAIDAFSSPYSSKAKRFFMNIAGSFVPAVAGQAARATDPVMRSSENVLGKWMSRSPGSSESLPPVRDMWGNPIFLGAGVNKEEDFGNWLAIGGNFFSPLYQSTVKAEPIDKELFYKEIRLNAPERTVGVSSLIKSGKPISIRLTDVEYDLLVRRMNSIKMGAFDGEFVMKDILNKTVQSEDYKNMSLDEQSDTIKKIYDVFKEQAVFEVKNIPSVRARINREHQLQIRESREKGGFESDYVTDDVTRQAIDQNDVENLDALLSGDDEDVVGLDTQKQQYEGVK